MRSRRAYAAQMRALVAARQCPPWYEFNKLANGKRRRLQMQAATSRHGSTRAQSCPRRELKHCSSITGQISHGFITVERNGPDWIGLSQICLTSRANRLTIGGGVRPSKN